MIYLLEHEAGYDVDTIGFPSISGCHAIVYLTTNGLFGYHNAGGSASVAWATRADKFARFVREHFLGGGSGLALYGASFVGDNRRGYSIGNAKAEWKSELRAFADAVGYSGRVRGYDLTRTGYGGSAYVEYRATGTSCTIHVKPWTESGVQRGTISKRNNHKKLLGSSTTTMITAVNNTGLNTVAASKL